MMKIRKINVVEYQYGEEKELQEFLYRSKVPILIKIKNFTDQFSLDYFEKYVRGDTTYHTFDNYRLMTHEVGDFTTVISDIKKNKPYRIFSQIIPRWLSAEVENHVPFWQTLPFRPRYFNPAVKVGYFFGGKGSSTRIHFDREHCSILHLCLCGKKQLLLFTEDQNDALYKLPFIGDSLIDFDMPWDSNSKQFPRLNEAEGYRVILEKGDMLYMPKNCWHYTRYLDASAAASYVFYPNKFFQFYGFFTGHFFMAYKEVTGLMISSWPIFVKFSQQYALATGVKKGLYKTAENILYTFMLPIVSLHSFISLKSRPRRLW